MTHDLDRTRLHELMRRELERFEREHPRSRELFERRARPTCSAGVPMTWMSEWAGGVPGLRGRGARGAVHRRRRPRVRRPLPRRHRRDGRPRARRPPSPRSRAQARDAGITPMLPTEDAAWVGEELHAALRPAAAGSSR